MRYLGIDYGTKRVGIALSDEEGRMAFPECILSNDHTLLPTLVSLIKEKGVGMIVVGESLDLEGKENPLMTKIRAFAEVLIRETSLPVAYEQEFFTSAAAARSPLGEQKAVARKVSSEKREHNDASAAALILQSYLDRIGK